MKCSDHEKRKTTFNILRTVCVGGLPDYSCTVVSASIFFFSTIILFSFIYLFIYFLFRHQRMCSWATQMQL